MLPVAAVLITVPVAVAIGETLAWQNARLGRGRLVDDQRVDDLQALATSVSILRDHRTTLEHAASLLGQLANDIFHGDYVSTVLRGGNGRLVPYSVGDDPGRPSPQTATLVETAVARAEVQLVAENGSTLLVIPLVGPTEIGGAVVVRRPRETDDPFTLAPGQAVRVAGRQRPRADPGDREPLRGPPPRPAHRHRQPSPRRGPGRQPDPG